MYCLPVKAKTLDELHEKIYTIVSDYYYGYTVHELNFTRPIEDCEWYSCLLLLTKDDE